MTSHDEAAGLREWARAAAALRASEDALDAVTLARLRAARCRALAAAGRPRTVNWALPMAIAAGLTAWAVAPRLGIEPAGPAAAPSADALDLLADQGGPDFYRDLELYEWLEARDGGRA